MKLFRGLAGYLLVTLAATATSPDASAPARETVVLLHGLGRTRLSMMPLAFALQRAGYQVVNLSYPWRSQTLEALATDWLPARLDRLPSASQLHFVTHSMGGILLRTWLARNSAPANLGHVVMLRPPNAGSELADRLAASRPLAWLLGVNGPRLGTAATSLPRTLGPWPASRRSLGIVAGDAPLIPFTDRWLPGPHDGKVSVASTHLAGQHAHRTLPISHTGLPLRRAAHRQVIAFLRDGRFAN